MNIVLKPELERFVNEKLQAGQHADPSAVVNEALELLQDQEQFTPEHEAYLRREIQRGMEQLQRGEYSDVTVDELIAEERRRMASSETHRTR